MNTTTPAPTLRFRRVEGPVTRRHSDGWWDFLATVEVAHDEGDVTDHFMVMWSVSGAVECHSGDRLLHGMPTGHMAPALSPGAERLAVAVARRGA